MNGQTNAHLAVRSRVATVLTVLTCAALTLAFTPSTAIADTPSLGVTITLPVASVHAATPAPIAVVVRTGAAPQPGALVSLQVHSSSGQIVPVVDALTGQDGVANLVVTFPFADSWTVTAVASFGGVQATSDPSTLTVVLRSTHITLSGPTGPVVFGSVVPLSALVTVDGLAAAGVVVTFTASAVLPVLVGSATTNADGVAELGFRPQPGTYRVVASTQATTTYDATTSAPITVEVRQEPLRIRFLNPKIVPSESTYSLAIGITDVTTQAAVPGVTVQVLTRRVGQLAWLQVATVMTRADGTATVPVYVWKDLEVSAKLGTGSPYVLAGANLVLHARALRPIVALPSNAPKPSGQYPNTLPAVGGGAAITVASIPPSVLKSMQGKTWHAGCTAVSNLRYITFNYWGFDGFRYRGALVVARPSTTQYMRVLAGLYSIGFAFRSVAPEDRFGKNPYGPGANDYKSMAADNTSAFNCRYVVGKERQRVWSPHSSGNSIDINPFENPYLAATGFFPDRWWFSRTHRCAVCFQPKSRAVAILGHHGFRWGAGYGDYQHFQR